MRKASLAEAKAQLSALVDAAEHEHRQTLILRHGKPAAVIAPVASARPRRRRLSAEEVHDLFAAFDAGSRQSHASAVEDLLGSRR